MPFWKGLLRTYLLHLAHAVPTYWHIPENINKWIFVLFWKSTPVCTSKVFWLGGGGEQIDVPREWDTVQGEPTWNLWGILNFKLQGTTQGSAVYSVSRHFRSDHPIFIYCNVIANLPKTMPELKSYHNKTTRQKRKMVKINVTQDNIIRTTINMMLVIIREQFM